MIAVWIRRFATMVLTAGVVAALLFGRTALAETAAAAPEPDAAAESTMDPEAGENGEDTNGSEAAAAADDTPAPANDASSDGKPSGDVFVPTEEISEDFAVSFPVDI